MPASRPARSSASSRGPTCAVGEAGGVAGASGASWIGCVEPPLCPTGWVGTVRWFRDASAGEPPWGSPPWRPSPCVLSPPPGSGSVEGPPPAEWAGDAPAPGAGDVTVPGACVGTSGNVWT